MNSNNGTLFGGLKSYVIFLVLTVFFGTSTVAYFAFQGIASNIVEEMGILFTHKQVLFDRARSLQPLLREEALAMKLARSPSIRAWANDENNLVLKKRGIEELGSFREMFRDKSYFFVVNKSGNYYFNEKDGRYSGKEYRYTLSPDNPKDRWYYATVLTDKECQPNVNHDKELNVTKVWINCLVRDNSKVVGLIGTGIDLTEFIQTAVETKQVGVNTIFIDQSGAIQAHKNTELIDFHSLTKRFQDRKTIFQLVESPEENEEFRLLLNSLRDGDVDFKSMFLSIGGKRYLAGAAFLESMGWFNVTLMDLDAVVNRSMFNHFAGLMAGALFITLLLVTVLFNHFVLNRIYRLEHSVQQVSDGKYDATAVDERHDEIGRLSKSFNIMAQTIGNHTKNLEQQIEKRTEEYKTAKEKAERATKLKDQFVSLVAHDLRGPIGSIRGFMELSLDKKLKQDEMRKYTQFGIDISEGLLEIIEKLLDIGRLQTGAITPDKHFFDVWFLVLEATTKLQQLADEKNIKIINNIPKNDYLFADRTLIGEVFLNLIGNAIKFTAKGGTATISMPEKRLITVSDTGSGISTDMLPNLFKHDVRTTGIGTAGETGTGLGLPMCSDIMKAHDGILRVETADNGTIIYMEFAEEKPIVLIADDQEVHRAIMKELIQTVSDVEFVEVDNGKRAIESLKWITPVLLITDINMPVMDGFQLLREIRDRHSSDQLPVIVSTSLSTPYQMKEDTIDTKTAAFNYGANDVVAKPIIAEDFIPRIRRYLPSVPRHKSLPT